MKLRILITGATGFIGRHLVRKLVSQGHELWLIQRSIEQVADGVHIINAPELSRSSIERAVSANRFDWVFHLASYGVNPNDRDPKTMLGINIDTTIALVKSFAQSPPHAIVVVGSGAEYDLRNVNVPVTEDCPLEIEKLYGSTKAAGSLGALATASALNLPLAVARLFGVFGPGEGPHRLLPAIVRNLVSGERVPLSSGLQKRDVLFVEDAVDALILIAKTLQSKPVQRTVLNVSSGEIHTVRAFAEKCADLMEADRSLLGFGDVAIRPDETMIFAGDASRMRAATGWFPRFSLDAGISISIQELKRTIYR